MSSTFLPSVHMGSIPTEYLHSNFTQTTLKRLLSIISDQRFSNFSIGGTEYFEILFL